MPSRSSTLEILQSKSLPEVVRDEIIQLIFSGKFAPGEKLGEEELADHLRVSRGPIREAFRSLEEAGLVRLSKNKGVFVRELTISEARDLYVVRAGFEEVIGRLLAPVVTDGQIRELREMVDAMEISSSAGNLDAYFPADMAFHDRIAQMTGNAKLVEIHRRIVNEMNLVRLQSIQRGGGIFVSNSEHRTIVDELEKRDVDAAGRAMSLHVKNAFERVAPLLKDVATDTKSSRNTADSTL